MKGGAILSKSARVFIVSSCLHCQHRVFIFVSSCLHCQHQLGWIYCISTLEVLLLVHYWKVVENIIIIIIHPQHVYVCDMDWHALHMESCVRWHALHMDLFLPCSGVPGYLESVVSTSPEHVT